MKNKRAKENLKQNEQTKQTGTVNKAKITLETAVTDGTKDSSLSLSVKQRELKQKDTDTLIIKFYSLNHQLCLLQEAPLSSTHQHTHTEATCLIQQNRSEWTQKGTQVSISGPRWTNISSRASSPCW